MGLSDVRYFPQGEKFVVEIDSRTWVYPEFLGLTDSHEIKAGSMTQFSKVRGHLKQEFNYKYL